MIKEKYDLYINRELSWLKFNERVLQEAECSANPLFERLNFCHIYNNNLDEFYMVRVGSLLDQSLLKKVIRDSKTHMTPQQQIDAINEEVHRLIERKSKAYVNNMKALAKFNIRHADIFNLTPEVEKAFKNYFAEHVIHLLSPQIIDNHHPFPFLENKKLYVGVTLKYKKSIKLGVVPIEKYIERVIVVTVDNEQIFITLEELIYHFIDKIFTNKNIISRTIFRVTRNTDIDETYDLSEEDIDYIDIMQELLKKRRKLAAVRLEFQFGVSSELKEKLCKNLHIADSQVFVQEVPLDLSYLSYLKKYISGNKSLFYSELKPQQVPYLKKDKLLAEQIMEKDILLHYPYNDIRYFIQLLDESAQDSEVISIKITLYRMAKYSEVIGALIKAVENGKDVSVVVELRARFDESNNIEWAKKLEEAGCKVNYGLEGYKVHSKLLLITRKTGDEIKYITHIGTGNFNEKTASIYTDISIFTAKQEIGLEAAMIFNSLSTGEFVSHTKHLLVAPKCLKNKIVALIDEEILQAKQGEKSQIILKMNSLTDKILINKLIEASQAGVEVTMIIRGICCLRPGIEGKTDHIKVISIVGRFLEHSRIYVFGTPNRAKVFISSADFMTRNTEKRIEVAAPIYDQQAREKIFRWLDIMCKDNVKARILNPDGTYTLKKDTGEKIEAQIYLFNEAYQLAQNSIN